MDHQRSPATPSGPDWSSETPTQLPVGTTRVRGSRIRPGDRIVVDEAGMLDLEAANALLDVIERTGANVAVVGDDYQALPVGHSGAMALFWRPRSRRVELTEIHRFRDPDWAELTARLRDSSRPASRTRRRRRARANRARHLRQQRCRSATCDGRGMVRIVTTGQTIALVTATHAEAQQISEAIQARRIESGAIDTPAFDVGSVGAADLRWRHRPDATQRQHLGRGEPSELDRQEDRRTST